MHRDKSIKEINKMDALERWNTAKEKLNNSDNNGAVSALINHLSIHENSRWLNFRPELANQVPTSRAANAFYALQMTNIHYEIIRLCTFWDPIDLDSNSVPTIVALADSTSVAQLVYNDHFSHYELYDKALAERWGNKAKDKLQNGVRDAKIIENSSILKSTRNYRDKLAHQIEQTREEKKGPVPVPRFGDERKLLENTISVMDQLYLSLHGTDFDWEGSKDMRTRNAAAFWKGVKIEVLN